MRALAIAKRAVPPKVRPRLARMRDRAASVGLRYRCPMCGWPLRTFHPYGLEHPVLATCAVVGGGLRPAGRCPVCGCIDRERLVYLYLRHETDVFTQGARLLHVAPERCLSACLGDVAGLDYVTADLDPARAMVQMDVTDIHYPDSWFGGIICNHVLEHIEDDARALREVRRVLRPGGWAILQVPISFTLPETYEDPSIVLEDDRERAFGQANHVRIYAADYVQRLEQAGFEVRRFEWTEEPHVRRFGGSGNRYGLNTEECVFCCT